ncbi:MAG: hypothetical protein GF310_01835 [candidate division Zixibacteria bacterium]|nr:hypothetical protein [candidate division Zixibacteria bacterium]
MKSKNFYTIALILLLIPVFVSAENRVEIDFGTEMLGVGAETVEVPVLCENDNFIEYMSIGFKVAATGNAFVQVVDLQVISDSRADNLPFWTTESDFYYPSDTVYISNNPVYPYNVNPGPLEEMFMLTLDLSCSYDGEICIDKCGGPQGAHDWIWAYDLMHDSISPVFNNGQGPVCIDLTILPCGFNEFTVVPENDVLVGKHCEGVSFQFEATHEFDPEYYKIEGFDFCYDTPVPASISEDGSFTFAPADPGIYEITVRAYGQCPNFALYTFDVILENHDLCGDANCDGDVNVSDAVNIINYVFIGGDPPAPEKAGDCNCDSTCNVSDAVWIINYVFIGGDNPCDTNGDDIPDC